MKSMKKLFMIGMIVLSLSLVTGSRAADVELKITVPDAWVNITIAAINSKWPKPKKKEGQSDTMLPTKTVPNIR